MLGLGIAAPAAATENFTPITMSAGAPAPDSPTTPYPASTDVAGYRGTVTGVTVYLNDVTHTVPDEMDVLLVGPQGQKVMLMSDAGGGSDLLNHGLRFLDSGPAMPDNTAIAGLTYKPTDHEPGEALPAPAPTGPYATALSAFNGTDPNGTWRLYVADDSYGDAGNIDPAWSLNITTTEGFGVADPGPAADYPSTLQVSGVVGPIAKLTAQLNDVAASWPDDLDVLLVGPGGQSALLMSDAGGGSSTVFDSRRLTFDSAAPLALPDESSFRSGTFLPTDHEAGADSFPAPAPPGPYATSLAAFEGTDPNGTWSLFVVDDGNAGYTASILSGFSLGITTPTQTVTSTGAPGGGSPTVMADLIRPVARGLAFGTPTFRAASRGASAVALRRVRPVGSRVSFRLSEPATARFTVERAARGVRQGRRCVRPRRGLRGRRCTRYVPQRGGFSRAGVAGLNRFRFTGRLRGRKLRPGGYRLVLVAADAAGNRSVPVRSRFRIVLR